jgi:hypothetical protein
MSDTHEMELPTHFDPHTTNIHGERETACGQNLCRTFRLTPNPESVTHYALGSGGLMGGWNAFMDDYRGRGWGIWIDRDCRWLVPQLLTGFPLVLPLGSQAQEWHLWKIEFAKRHELTRQMREPRGVLNVWWNKRDTPRLMP